MADLSTDRSSDPEHSGRPPDSEVQAQIERILKSKLFADSERLRRFLNWTVEQVLKGEGERIKQFTIGQEVFDPSAATFNQLSMNLDTYPSGIKDDWWPEGRPLQMD